MKDFTLTFKKWFTGKVEVMFFQGPMLPGLGTHVLDVVEKRDIVDWKGDWKKTLEPDLVEHIERLAKSISRAD